jgi:DtxR family transcriptional regulator, Mn-dependent transcriptional regulator
MAKKPSKSSESVENFVKAIYTLQQELAQQGTLAEEDMLRVSTNALKEALAISAPSVTDMAQRLMKSGLVDYRKYQGIGLTEEGTVLALKLIRRHRLIELYLVRELSYELHEIHNEAEKLEHAVSDRFIEAIDAKLGKPEFDPHGDPIPDVHGAMIQRELQPLSQLKIGTPAKVSRLISSDTDMLQHSLDRGFKLEVPVLVLARDPFNGPITVSLGGKETVIGYTVAEAILVQLLD